MLFWGLRDSRFHHGWLVTSVDPCARRLASSQCLSEPQRLGRASVPDSMPHDTWHLPLTTMDNHVEQFLKGIMPTSGWDARVEMAWTLSGIYIVTRRTVSQDPWDGATSSRQDAGWGWIVGKGTVLCTEGQLTSWSVQDVFTLFFNVIVLCKFITLED